MYDMYAWDQPAATDEHADATATPRATQATRATQVTRPVQEALDRRDNGGAAASRPGG